MAEIIDRRLNQIRSEYLEMPGLSLTVSQAGRLWGFADCDALLRSLVETRFLSQTRMGTFVRRPEQTRVLETQAVRVFPFPTQVRPDALSASSR